MEKRCAGYVMCFQEKKNTQLRKTGKNVSAHLRQHEKSAEHITNMATCCILSQELQTNTAIHQVNQDVVALAVNHRKEILKRFIGIVNNLSVILHLVATQTGCLSLFLGKVEMMAQFDPVMREHLRGIWAKDPSDTCLSKHIQNELIYRVYILTL